MSSDSIQILITNKQQELEQAYDELNKANEDYSNTEEVYSKIVSTYNSFISSIEDRRFKLNGIEDLLHNVNTARIYNEKATDLLSGNDFFNAENDYSDIESSISNELRRINDNITSIQQRIYSLNSEIGYLKHDYQRAIAEERENIAKETAERVISFGK